MGELLLLKTGCAQVTNETVVGVVCGDSLRLLLVLQSGVLLLLLLLRVKLALAVGDISTLLLLLLLLQ